FRNLVESCRDKVAPAADPALRIGPRRKRQPRPATDLLMDDGAHRFLIDGCPRNRARRPRPNFRMRRVLQWLCGIMRNVLCLRWHALLRKRSAGADGERQKEQ